MRQKTKQNMFSMKKAKYQLRLNRKMSVLLPRTLRMSVNERGYRNTKVAHLRHHP